MDIIGRSYMLITSGSKRVNYSLVTVTNVQKIDPSNDSQSALTKSFLLVRPCYKLIALLLSNGLLTYFPVSKVFFSPYGSFLLE